MTIQTTEVTPIQSEIAKIPQAIKLANEYAEFMKFCATPRVLRELKTQRDFAKKFGVSEDTLTDWKRRPGFLEEIRQIVLEREHEELPGIIEALRAKAEKGDPAAIRLWLQYIGELQTKKTK